MVKSIPILFIINITILIGLTANADLKILKQGGYSFCQDNLTVSSDIMASTNTIAKEGNYSSISLNLWMSFITPVDSIDFDFSGWQYHPDRKMYPNDSVLKNKFSLGLKYNLPSSKWLFRIGPDYSIATFDRHLVGDKEDTVASISFTEISINLGIKIQNGTGIYLYYLTTISPNSIVKYNTPGIGVFTTL